MMIRLEIEGELGGIRLKFDSEDGGKAMAIQRTIQFLNSKLKEAIADDHRLHELGFHPDLADYGGSQDQSGSHP